MLYLCGHALHVSKFSVHLRLCCSLAEVSFIGMAFKTNLKNARTVFVHDIVTLQEIWTTSQVCSLWISRWGKLLPPDVQFG